MAFLDYAGLAHFKRLLDKQFKNKINTPVNNGTNGKILRSRGGSETYWADPVTPEELSGAVQEWMDENVTPTSSTVLIDETLTQSGAAAQAKAAGGLVKVSYEQPEESSNKLWIEPRIDEVVLPTYNDLKDLSRSFSSVYDSDAEEADIDISDADGNVIVRIADGHIKTKNFDSSSISEADLVKDSNKENVDLDISDGSGNVVMRIANGHIQTKEFNSSELPALLEAMADSIDEKISEPEAVGTSGQVLGLDNDLNPVWVNQTSGNNDTSIRDSEKTNVDLDISDSLGNVLLRVANGHIQTKNFNSADKKNEATIFTVKTTGGDFTSIRAAIEAATEAGASDDNPYIIQIEPGNYDTLSYFTESEIEESNFWGLMVTNGITLEGTGTLCDQTVLYAELDPNEYSTEKRNDISALNFRGSVGLKNLTVKSKNLRYAIHDDFSFSSQKPKIRRLENCNIYAELTTSWNIGNVSYGAGTDGNKIFIFNDCDFGDTLFIHTDVGAVPNLAIMHNCKAFQFLCKDYPSTAINHIYMYGCSFKWIREGIGGTSWTSQHLFMHGDTKDAFVEVHEGMQYELGNSFRIQNPTVTAYPRAITSASTGRYHIQSTSNADQTIGILYYYDAVKDYALVQYGGWVCAESLGFESPAVGKYLVVGSGGTLSLEDSGTNSIGKVVFENENNKHFIKLSI